MQGARKPPSVVLTDSISRHFITAFIQIAIVSSLITLAQGRVRVANICVTVTLVTANRRKRKVTMGLMVTQRQWRCH